MAKYSQASFQKALKTQASPSAQMRAAGTTFNRQQFKQGGGKVGLAKYITGRTQLSGFGKQSARQAGRRKKLAKILSKGGMASKF